MKNIEKYEEEIKKQILKDRDIPCIARELRDGDSGCGECRNCVTCGLEMLHWLLEECKEPILTEEDKKIIKDVINVFNSFKKEIVDIRKRHICRGCYLYINYIDGGEDVSSIETHTTLPFNGDKLFKGMELDKRYTLEELEL